VGSAGLTAVLPETLCCFPSPLAGEGAEIFFFPFPLALVEGARNFTVFPSPLAGEGARRAGEGVYNINSLFALFYTPHRRCVAASPTRGEAKTG